MIDFQVNLVGHHRVAGAQGRTHEGTGIGLALVQELVKLHKGSVAVESTLGRGTIQNAYVPGDNGTGGKAGMEVNLNFASNSHPNEDFTGAQVGTLLNFCPNFGGVGLSQLGGPRWERDI